MNGESAGALRARAATLAELAREDDLGPGDITGALVDANESAEFHLVARRPGVFAGRVIAGDVIGAYGDSIELRWTNAGVDGATVDANAGPLAVLRGSCQTVLAAERVLLNFLQRLSGVATATRAFVDAVAGTSATIYDTRKTTPGWRLLEKYAVRCGGGCNHRMGLHDAILIKDNHLAGIPMQRLAGRVFEMLNAAAALERRPAFVEVEAETIEQVGALLKVTGIDIILLDNFPPDDLRRAVYERDGLNLRGKVALEASGGVTLETVRDVAATGVERISVGAITHSAAAIDLALERVSQSAGRA